MLWRAELSTTTGTVVFTWRQLDDSEQQEYLCVMGEIRWRGLAQSEHHQFDNVRQEWNANSRSACYLAARFVDEHPFDVLWPARSRLHRRFRRDVNVRPSVGRPA